MRSIWKYTVAPGREPQRVAMPKGAVLLHAHEQHGEICVWADVDLRAELSDRLIEVFGTGWEMPSADLRYIGTAHLDGGRLVFHVFERLP